MTQEPRPFKAEPNNLQGIDKTLDLVRTPAEALFMVVFLDTMSFLSSVHTALDKIVMASADGDALRTRPVVSNWRKSLVETQLRLSPLQDSISGLLNVLGVERPSKETQTLSDQVLKTISETIAKFERANRRYARNYLFWNPRNSLMKLRISLSSLN